MFFDRVVIKKGGEVRLDIPYQDFSISKETNEAEFLKNLNSLENLIKASDTIFDDFTIEFHKGGSVSTGIPIWRANILRQKTDFSVIEEGIKTYVQLSDQYPLNSGDQLLFSHTVPQSLIEGTAGTGQGSGSSVDAQLQALSTQIAGILVKNQEQDSEITNLQSAIGVQTATTLYYGFGHVFAVANEDVALAKAEAKTSFNTASNRNMAQVPNLSIGKLLKVIAPSPEGFYRVWVALEASKVNTLRIRNDITDESDGWVEETSVVHRLNNLDYKLFVRLLPLGEGEVMDFVIKNFR